MYIRPITTWSIAVIVLSIVFLSADANVDAQTVVNFEDANIPTGATMGTQYSDRGVLFDGGYLDTDPAAHSGQRVVRAIPPGVEFFQVVPFVIRFRPEMQVTRVKLFAGSQSASLNGKLTGFDSLGNVVAVAGHLVPQNTFTTAFEVTAVTPGITRVELQLEGTSFVSIDDLEFDGGAAPPLPTQPPVVQLTQPINGINIDSPGDIPKIDIAGMVTGDGLLSTVTVTVAYRLPPESTALPLTLVLSLTGTGTTRQFMLMGGMIPPLGPVTVTASAKNIAGLEGTAASTLTNLPLAVRNRFFTDGGAAAYGDFQYGLLGCAMAVYERGAISGRNGGAIAIRGDIFTKWLSLRGPFNERGWFGCPTNEEGDTIGGARSQPFERGRIYARLPGIAPPGAVYVPAVFVDAIDKRDGDVGVGLPLADPTDSAGAMQTWLFQQFSRPNATDLVPLLPSTLEIRGTPPTLWMERQAGTWLHDQPAILSRTFCRSDVADHEFRCDFDKERNKSGATLWEGFTCSGNLGPCSVAEEPQYPPPITAQNHPDFKNKFCSGTTYVPAFRNPPPEWKAIRGEYDATPVSGAVVSAKMEDLDNGFTHRTHNANCPYLGLGLAIGSVLAPVPALGSYVLAEEYGLTCGSDFEFFVRPLGPQVVTTPELPSLFGDNNKDNIKSEYEDAYAAEAHNFLGAPAVGDLVHMTGRWIVDCAHEPFKTELHPLFSYARAKTVISETNTFTGLEEPLFGGKPATRIAIWVNGWYPGGENNAIEFDIFPPPRPSPTAVLHVVKPVDSGSGNYHSAVDVALEYAFRPTGSASHVHLRFTAPRRENMVTRDGEMIFQPGRQYWGIWYLYWGD
jgi:hypothetical protein